MSTETVEEVQTPPVEVKPRKRRTKREIEEQRHQLHPIQEEVTELRTEDDDESESDFGSDSEEQPENVIPLEERPEFQAALREAAELRAKSEQKKEQRPDADERVKQLEAQLEEERKKVRYPAEPEPGPYLVAHHFEWIESDFDKTIGFAVKVRTSLTNFEKRKLAEKDQYLHFEYIEKYKNASEEEQESMLSPRQYQREMLAPYVYGWNAHYENEEGEIVKAPVPREYGPDAFEYISEDEFEWLVYVVIGGYTVLGKAGPWRREWNSTGSS